MDNSQFVKIAQRGQYLLTPPLPGLHRLIHAVQYSKGFNLCAIAIVAMCGIHAT